MTVAPTNGVIDVVALNTATQTVSAPITIPNPISGTPKMAITPNGNQLYVSGNGINGVSVIDTVTNTIEGNPIPVYQGNSLVVTPDGTSVYVNSQGYTHTVDVISTATNTVTASIPVNSDLHSLVVSPDSKDVYLYSFPNSGDPSVSVINTVTNTITRGNPIAIPGVQATGEVSGLVIDPDGHYLYLPNTADGTPVRDVSGDRHHDTHRC